MSSRKEFINWVFLNEVDECLLWPFAVRKSSGYGAHSIRISGERKNVDAHRYVCRLAHGEPPSKAHQAAHNCGQPLCCNPKHLRWALSQENMSDAKTHKTLKGGGRYMHKLNAQLAAEIRATNLSLVAIAHKYDIGVSYASKVRRGLVWAA